MTITQDGSKSLVSFGTMAHGALAAETGEHGSAGTLGPDVAAWKERRVINEFTLLLSSSECAERLFASKMLHTTTRMVAMTMILRMAMITRTLDHQGMMNSLFLLAFPNTNAVADQQGQRQSIWNLVITKFEKNDITVHANPILKSITNTLNMKSNIQLL